MRTLFILVCFLTFPAIPTLAQNGPIRFDQGTTEIGKAASMSWAGHFGGRKEDSASVFTLMTQGGFRAPTSSNFKDLIKTWLLEHPNAEASVVYVMPGPRDTLDSKIKAVWIKDGAEYLNLFLVKSGGCPAGTMVLNPGDATPITRQVYEDFEKRVWEAQAFAKRAKIGIWSVTK